jgi:PAH dioxygenase small subunit
VNSVSDDVFVTIQRFLYLEASYLDRRAYSEWLTLLTDDVHYRVSAKINRDASLPPLDFAFIDSDATGLRQRVDQISNPRLTHAENPPSLARRFVCNLQAEYGDNDNEYIATTNLLVYRTRPEQPQGNLYAGMCHDILRRVEGKLRLARRNVELDQSMLYGAVSILF